MKIAVINLSGNTGKTTLAKHLFAPQLNAKRVQIEDTNIGDGEPDLELAASKFKQLAAELNVALDDENFVIDIGASNAKLMVEHFAQLKTTRSDIDFWIIPVVPSAKQKADSINTVATLTRIGIAPGKIVMVMNNVTDTQSVEHDFSTILQLRDLGVNVADQVVLASEVFEMMKGQSETVFDLVKTPPDFKSLLKAARANNDAQAVNQIGTQMVIQDLAESAADNLQAVFQSTPLAPGVSHAVKGEKKKAAVPVAA